MVKRANVTVYVVLWLLLTLSLVGWWLVYGLRQLEKLARLENSLPAHLIQQQQMLHWEGLTLFALLIVGGSGLLYYAVQEKRRNDQVQEFFATLTHELKTPLASLRLQAESLQEDLSSISNLSLGSQKLIDRLVADTVRLELQVENALFLASVRSQEQLHVEAVSVESVLERLKIQWPELQFIVTAPVFIKADTRALEGILKNLIQNAKVHGKAKLITIDAKTSSDSDKICLSIADDGLGFTGDIKKLGKLFSRPTAQSGSGVGLYLSKNLAERMNGRLEFSMCEMTHSGFVVNLWLQSASVT